MTISKKLLVGAGVGCAIWWVIKKYRKTRNDKDRKKKEPKPNHEEIIYPASLALKEDKNDQNVRQRIVQMWQRCKDFYHFLMKKTEPDNKENTVVHPASQDQKDLTACQVRQTFINFFLKKDHNFIKGSSVIPHEGLGLKNSFTNSGMNQFVPIIKGETDMVKFTRVVNTQKCIRAGGKHNDFEDVGQDNYHHTFFEMLGNWSFGDYSKEEMYTWAWEFLTEELKLEKKRLYVTYFGGDESLSLKTDIESFHIWKKIYSKHLDENQIQKYIVKGYHENFWEMGQTGPCGPCSEIHYDRIGDRNAAKLVNTGDPDVIELWNIVFIRYNKDCDNRLTLLPKQHVDCGMGLERLVSIVQKKRSNYNTDLFTPLFNAIEQKSNIKKKYEEIHGAKDKDCVNMAYRIVADHIRCLTIAFSDDETLSPGNTGRKYVLRKILRRGVYYATEILKFEETSFGSLVHVVVKMLGKTFPELQKNPKRIEKIINAEEEQFRKTLTHGSSVFKKNVEKLEGTKIFPVEIAWTLKDTHGLPVSITKLMCEERGLKLDMKKFDEYERKAKERSKQNEKCRTNN
ncbi:alanine--tRNA ligase, cytoplasmic-like [Artemia franciscana]|uniref:alanine--tRNA ligase, cytoplasmic-like n=1 Tax=Artemia franciscana TaxID=6661 RepID=UPI0032DAB621